MSIWGKIIGGTAGFVIGGGPLGALIGAAAGHFIDRKVEQVRQSEAQDHTFDPSAPPGFKEAIHHARQQAREQMRAAAFATTVVALCAKMAKADGQVSRAEIDAFKRTFNVPPDQMEAVGRLFDEARKTADDFELYARQAASLFSDTPQVLEDLLMALLLIAQADGVIHPAEQALLQRVAEIFAVSPQAWERVRAGAASGGSGGGRASASSGISDPYAVLGVAPTATDSDIKAAYRKLLRENHPDTVIAQGLPEEFVEIATRKMAAINAAWDDIARMRGLKK
ncbi:TerB family tellurite resistance protein [Insolitispirillum peregrinum]|uniref:DnaJ like chaperone protein n=1 Tax=Insolitispirillum peregrinum TaxID=80876 RepID=A0A1N7PBK4_9PROT|nr:TerB family tellurite resistance protein [Insolitispirillum peregrinum]SIT07974.1 DnaJ like chaperone protein [Insolitispirillum peregrinum]